MRDKLRQALDLINATLTLMALLFYIVIITYTNDPTIPFYAH
jgi:hypothetical protein